METVIFSPAQLTLGMDYTHKAAKWIGMLHVSLLPRQCYDYGELCDMLLVV